MSVARRAAFVAGVVIALIIAATFTTTGAPRDRAVGTGTDVGTASTWYCAEGTSNPNGRADEVIVLGNVGTTKSNALVTVFSGSDAAPVRRSVAVAAGAVARVKVSDIVAVAEPGVLVEVRGGPTVVEHQIQRGTDQALGPCAREPVPRVSFAGGSTMKGAELWLALFNPFPDDAIVDVRGVTGDGVRAPGALQGVVVPRFSRLSVPVHEAIPRADLVAVEMTVRRGRAIAEQSLALDATDGRQGLALSEGGVASRRWAFPIGLTGSGHQERLVLANRSNRDVRVTVRFALDAAAAVEPESLILPGTTALAVDTKRVPPDVGFSVSIRADRPIVAEMVGANGAPQPADVRGLAADLGFSVGARRWAVVPARLDAGSTDSLAIVSMDGRPHRVQVVRSDGPRPRVVARINVPATGRQLVDLAKLVSGVNVAVTVRANGPVAVERESTRPGLTRSRAIPG
ncbi:MAG: DUF5719 family protein [Acidimicrobiia bacterium]